MDEGWIKQKGWKEKKDGRRMKEGLINSTKKDERRMDQNERMKRIEEEG